MPFCCALSQTESACSFSVQKVCTKCLFGLEWTRRTLFSLFCESSILSVYCYIRTYLKNCSVPCTWLQTPCPRRNHLNGRLCKGICLKNKPAQEGPCHRLISKHSSRIHNRRVFSHSHKSNSSPDRRTWSKWGLSDLQVPVNATCNSNCFHSRCKSC